MTEKDLQILGTVIVVILIVKYIEKMVLICKMSRSLIYSIAIFISTLKRALLKFAVSYPMQRHPIS